MKTLSFKTLRRNVAYKVVKVKPKQKKNSEKPKTCYSEITHMYFGSLNHFIHLSNLPFKGWGGWEHKSLCISRIFVLVDAPRQCRYTERNHCISFTNSVGQPFFQIWFLLLISLWIYWWNCIQPFCVTGVALQLGCHRLLLICASTPFQSFCNYLCKSVLSSC